MNDFFVTPALDEELSSRDDFPGGTIYSDFSQWRWATDEVHIITNNTRHVALTMKCIREWISGVLTVENPREITQTPFPSEGTQIYKALGCPLRFLDSSSSQCGSKRGNILYSIIMAMYSHRIHTLTYYSFTWSSLTLSSFILRVFLPSVILSYSPPLLKVISKSVVSTLKSSSSGEDGKKLNLYIPWYLSLSDVTMSHDIYDIISVLDEGSV